MAAAVRSFTSHWREFDRITPLQPPKRTIRQGKKPSRFKYAAMLNLSREPSEYTEKKESKMVEGRVGITQMYTRSLHHLEHAYARKH